MLPIPVDAELVAAHAAELGPLAREAEAAGFARVWAPELYRSATIPLAAAAATTERIEIATGIALAFTRSPFVLALEALDLDELSGGRMVVGLGAGVRRLNERWHAVCRLRPAGAPDARPHRRVPRDRRGARGGARRAVGGPVRRHPRRRLPAPGRPPRAVGFRSGSPR